MARCEGIVVIANDDYAIIINGARFSSRRAPREKTRGEKDARALVETIDFAGQKAAKRVDLKLHRSLEIYQRAM